MNPGEYYEKCKLEKKKRVYRANVRKNASVLRYLLTTDFTLHSEINNAYFKLVLS